MGIMVCDCGAPSHCDKCPCCAHGDGEVWNVHHVDVVEARWWATVTIHLMAGGRVVYEFSADSHDTGGDGLSVTRTDHAT